MIGLGRRSGSENLGFEMVIGVAVEDEGEGSGIGGGVEFGEGTGLSLTYTKEGACGGMVNGGLESRGDVGCEECAWSGGRSPNSIVGSTPELSACSIESRLTVVGGVKRSCPTRGNWSGVLSWSCAFGALLELARSFARSASAGDSFFSPPSEKRGTSRRFGRCGLKRLDHVLIIA